MAKDNALHEHDLVRVEDAANGVAWETCKTCRHRTKDEPWTPVYVDPSTMREVDLQASTPGHNVLLDTATETGEA